MNLKPRNVGLLFFNEEPEKFFPATQIDVVHFPQELPVQKLLSKRLRGQFTYKFEIAYE